MTKKNYKVNLTVMSVHSYEVLDCNSPEEAESIAEGLLTDGDDGEVEVLQLEDTEIEEIEGEE